MVFIPKFWKTSGVPKLDLSAEDCIAVLDLTPELAPDVRLMAPFGAAASNLKAWEVVWDLRAIEGDVYNDIVDAYGVAAQEINKAPTVLARPGREVEIEEALRPAVWRDAELNVMGARGKQLLKKPLDLAPFDESWLGSAQLVTAADLARELDLSEKNAEALLMEEIKVAIDLGIVPDNEEAAYAALDDIVMTASTSLDTVLRVEEEVEDERVAILDAFLRRIASNSLLAQLAFVEEAGHVSVVPMHGNGLNDLDCGDNILAVRPARKGAASQWARFGGAIEELESLINDPWVQEAQIESLLIRNPLFLRGLNYSECYHQVILPLEEGRYLKPDVIVEPVSRGWSDIIDLKLPKERIFIGTGDRPRLSQAIAEAASQLRQYARWFDDRKVAKTVEDKYGFRCFKPRQVVIIGRDPREFSEAQREAARTAYPDLEIVTYDRLLDAARSRLLF